MSQTNTVLQQTSPPTKVWLQSIFRCLSQKAVRAKLSKGFVSWRGMLWRGMSWAADLRARRVVQYVDSVCSKKTCERTGVELNENTVETQSHRMAQSSSQVIWRSLWGCARSIFAQSLHPTGVQFSRSCRAANIDILHVWSWMRTRNHNDRMYQDVTCYHCVQRPCLQKVPKKQQPEMSSTDNSPQQGVTLEETHDIARLSQAWPEKIYSKKQISKQSKTRNTQKNGGPCHCTLGFGLALPFLCTNQILLMAQMLHQLVGSLSHQLQCFWTSWPVQDFFQSTIVCIPSRKNSHHGKPSGITINHNEATVHQIGLLQVFASSWKTWRKSACAWHKSLVLSSASGMVSSCGSLQISNNAALSAAFFWPSIAMLLRQSTQGLWREVCREQNHLLNVTEHRAPAPKVDVQCGLRYDFILSDVLSFWRECTLGS